MIDTPSRPVASSARRTVRRTVAVTLVLGAVLVGGVAVDGSEPVVGPPTSADDDSYYRRLVNQGHVPRTVPDDDEGATHRLVNQGLVPRPTIE